MIFESTNFYKVQGLQTSISSPSDFAITTAPQESLQTFVAVLNISSILSTDIINPIASSGSPMADKIIVIITIPAIGS